MNDFNVNIIKKTKELASGKLGMILILDDTKDVDYTVFDGLESLQKQYDETTEVYKIANRIFEQKPAPEKIAVIGKTTELTTELIELLENHLEEDWFFLTCTKNSNEVITALSEWIEKHQKMYFTTIQDLELPSQIEAENTVVMYHDNVDAYASEGLAAYLSTQVVGSFTAKFKHIEGVEGATITKEQLKKLHDDGGFSYVKKKGKLQTSEGKTTSGEYIDVVMGSIFIKTRMEFEEAMLAYNNKKIGYSNKGIAQLVDVAKRVLDEATENGIILNEGDKGVYSIEYTTREDTPLEDRMNRQYNGIKWKATLDGAIHGGNIDGILEL